MSMEEIKELIDSRQYTRLRQELAELQEADIAAVLEELPKDELIRVFRILPKTMAAMADGCRRRAYIIGLPRNCWHPLTSIRMTSAQR